MKLPALYLIDSVSKNIGEPYVSLFAGELISAFTRAFQSLHDRKVEAEFVRVLKTWRGVYPEPMIRELEKRHEVSVAAAVPSTTNGHRSSSHKRSHRHDAALSQAVIEVLVDLRTAVSQPAHLYDDARIASIFAHVQINDRLQPESTSDKGWWPVDFIHIDTNHTFIYS